MARSTQPRLAPWVRSVHIVALKGKKPSIKLLLPFQDVVTAAVCTQGDALGWVLVAPPGALGGWGN